MRLPTLNSDPSVPGREVLFAVYAPFGTDETLSRFPDGRSRELAEHPLYRALLQVAASGVHVAALIDRVGTDTCLLRIPGGEPAQAKVTSRWKQQMDAPETLAGFLRRAHADHPEAAVVLAMEGHGAGYLPEIDVRQLATRRVTDNGRFEWRIAAGQGAPVLPQGSPLLPQGSPLLPQGSPLLPQGSPLLPVNHMPLSTWGIGAALRSAVESGVPKPAVIHFDNCFNMAVELLHTVSPCADFATGYCNYNFFTAGAPYPSVFERLRLAGSASSEALAGWFADENRRMLHDKGHHPTVGGVVRLSRLREIAERVDDLADALLAALRGASVADRPGVVARIRQAVRDARQYDSVTDYVLETPDALTDLLSFANTLQRQSFGPHQVAPAAAALAASLAGIKRYGESDSPWVDEDVRWDFSDPALAMSIFFPDPLLTGLWDWRSPFYLDVNPDSMLPPVQPQVIEFLKATDWVDFLVEYHRDAPYVRLLPAAIPDFPVFNAQYVPPGKPDRCPPDRQPDGPAGGRPSSR